MEKNWYVVHTYAGYENKVKQTWKKGIHGNAGQDLQTCSHGKELEVKNGKRKPLEKVFRVMLVEMIMTDDSWYVVRNTPG